MGGNGQEEEMETQKPLGWPALQDRSPDGMKGSAATVSYGHIRTEMF